jgi:transcriptional regulator with XRE-family HTH domain
MSDFTEALRKDPAFRKAYEANRPKRELALTLRKMRNAKGYTQADVAARSGLSQSHVSKLEAATGSMPEIETVRRYAEACGMGLRLDFQPLGETDAAEPASEAPPVVLVATRPDRRVAVFGAASIAAAAVAGAAAAGDAQDFMRVAHLTEAQVAAARRGEPVTLDAKALDQPMAVPGYSVTL